MFDNWRYFMSHREQILDLINRTDDKRSGWFREYGQSGNLTGVSYSCCSGNWTSIVMPSQLDGFMRHEARCGNCGTVSKLVEFMRERKIKKIDDLPSRPARGPAAPPFRELGDDDSEAIYTGDAPGAGKFGI